MAGSPTTTATGSPTASASCIPSMKPGKNGYLPPESCDAILFYVPSFGAAVLFCVLYGLTAVIHIAQAIIYKKRYAWVVIMGALWELAAFVCRALQTHNQASENLDTMYTLFFLLAPIWINAFVYMTLGRMLYFYHPDRRIVHISAHRFGTIFVCLDIFAFIVQAGGASMASQKDTGTSNIVTTGLHVYMGGIGLQELFILCFTGVLIELHRVLIKLEERGLQARKFSSGPIPWRWLFYVLYFALFMITVRIIFRISQYAKGTDPNNPVLSHEAYEYVFDAAPMFLALVALNIIHPGRNLQGPDSKFEKLSRAQKKEKKRLDKLKKANGSYGSASGDEEAHPFQTFEGYNPDGPAMYHPVGGQYSSS